MNIFVTSENPIQSAHNLCDKHVPKLIVEDFQMLSCAVIRHDAPTESLPLTKSGQPAKGGYHRHPCSIWAGDTRANFDWLCEHAKETCKEYTFRFGKTHFCEKGIYTLSSLNYLVPDGPLQEFAVAISDHMNCRQLPNFNVMSVVDKYRAYYILDKKDISKWTHGRQKPEWINSCHL